MPEPRDVEQCEFMHVHEDIVAQVEKNMPDEEVLYDLAEHTILSQGMEHVAELLPLHVL